MAMSGLPTAATASANSFSTALAVVRSACSATALRPGGLNGGDGGVRVGLGSGAVVVDRHRLGALFGQIAGDQPAQVLGAAGDEDGFALD